MLTPLFSTHVHHSLTIVLNCKDITTVSRLCRQSYFWFIYSFKIYFITFWLLIPTLFYYSYSRPSKLSPTHLLISWEWGPFVNIEFFLIEKNSHSLKLHTCLDSTRRVHADSDIIKLCYVAATFHSCPPYALSYF